MYNLYFQEIRPIYAARMTNDDQKAKEAAEIYANKTFGPFVKIIEKQLIDNDTGFLVGNQVCFSF